MSNRVSVQTSHRGWFASMTIEGLPPAYSGRVRLVGDDGIEIGQGTLACRTDDSAAGGRPCSGCGGERFDEAVRGNPAAMEQVLREHAEG